MDISTISGAYTGLKAAKDIATAVLRMKLDADLQLKIHEILGKLGQAQDNLFSARDELQKLQDENHLLQDQLRQEKDWGARLSTYKLTEAEGGAIVFESKNAPHHYACPACIEKHQIQILQPDNDWKGTFVCSGPACGKTFPVKEKRKPSATRVKTNRGRY